MNNLIRIGFWSDSKENTNDEYLWPHDFVDLNWDKREKSKIIKFLNNGNIYANYKGSSRCRICNVMNGSRDLFDGKYLWPEGFAHYIDKHNVKPAQNFIDYVLACKND